MSTRQTAVRCGAATSIVQKDVRASRTTPYVSPPLLRGTATVCPTASTAAAENRTTA